MPLIVPLLATSFFAVAAIAIVSGLIVSAIANFDKIDFRAIGLVIAVLTSVVLIVGPIEKRRQEREELERQRVEDWQVERDATVAAHCSAYGLSESRWSRSPWDLPEEAAFEVQTDQEVVRMTVGIGNPFGAGDALGYPMCRFGFQPSGRTLYAYSNEYGPHNLMHIPRGTNFSDRLTYDVGRWYAQRFGHSVYGDLIDPQETWCFSVHVQWPLPTRQDGTLDEVCMDALYSAYTPPADWRPVPN